MTQKPHILIIEGRFYPHIAKELLAGAAARLHEAGATFETVTVPGALEIPLALAVAVRADRIGPVADGRHFLGCVALGCVIRGETSHYEVVVNQSARALYTLATTHALALGNGILTVENEAQALERAAVAGKNKGRDAVEACLDLIAIAQGFAKG